MHYSVLGYTLVETLIALGLFSLILLALATTQMKSLTHQQEGFYYEVAMLQAQNQMNRVTAGDRLNEGTWQENLQQILPKGIGLIKEGREIIVAWKSQLMSCEDLDAELASDYACVRLPYTQ